MPHTPHTLRGPRGPHTPRAPRFTKQPAFNLIELLITTVIVAVLATVAALSFSGAKNGAVFNDQKTKVVDLLQQARSYSLSNVLVDSSTEKTTDYYILEIDENTITLSAIGTSSTTSTTELTSLELQEGYTFALPSGASKIEIYYIPPYGEICFYAYDCSDSTEEISFILSGPDDRKATITLNVFAGYPEVE